jgi:hypothetical protein
MVSSRMRDMWPADEPNDLLNLVQRSRMSMVKRKLHHFFFMHINFKFIIFLPPIHRRQQLQNDDMNGANLMDMMSDEAMLEHLAPNLAKSFPRKIINNLDVANLLKQVQSSTKSSPSSSTHSISPPHSASPSIPVPSTSASSMLLTPVAPSTSIEPPSK